LLCIEWLWGPPIFLTKDHQLENDHNGKMQRLSLHATSCRTSHPVANDTLYQRAHGEVHDVNR